MTGQKGSVRVTLFRADAGPAGTFAMVAYDDGTLDILHDGHPAAKRTWTPDELNECIEEFRQMTRMIENHYPVQSTG